MPNALAHEVFAADVASPVTDWAFVCLTDMALATSKAYPVAKILITSGKRKNLVIAQSQATCYTPPNQ